MRSWEVERLRGWEFERLTCCRCHLPACSPSPSRCRPDCHGRCRRCSAAPSAPIGRWSPGWSASSAPAGSPARPRARTAAGCRRPSATTVAPPRSQRRHRPSGMTPSLARLAESRRRRRRRPATGFWRRPDAARTCWWCRAAATASASGGAWRAPSGTPARRASRRRRAPAVWRPSPRRETGRRRAAD